MTKTTLKSTLIPLGLSFLAAASLQALPAHADMTDDLIERLGKDLKVACPVRTNRLFNDEHGSIKIGTQNQSLQSQIGRHKDGIAYIKFNKTLAAHALNGNMRARQALVADTCNVEAALLGAEVNGLAHIGGGTIFASTQEMQEIVNLVNSTQRFAPVPGR